MRETSIACEAGLLHGPGRALTMQSSTAVILVFYVAIVAVIVYCLIMFMELQWGYRTVNVSVSGRGTKPRDPGD